MLRPHAREAHDPDLVTAIRRGDRTALEALFHAHYDGLCRFTEGYLGSREAAQEVVQQLFLRLWEQREQWVVRTSIRTYLYGAARNRALDYLKHRRVEERWQERIAWADHVPGMGEPSRPADELAEASDFEAALDRALANLPERYRTVFELRSRQGLSMAEVAQALDIPFKTAEARASRALKALRAALSAFRP